MISKTAGFRRFKIDKKKGYQILMKANPSIFAGNFQGIISYIYSEAKQIKHL